MVDHPRAGATGRGSPRAAPESLHLVIEFGAPLAAGAREALQLSGIRLLDYLGQHAYFAAVRANVDARRAMRIAPIVGVLDIRPEWKVHAAFSRGAPPAWAVVPEADATRAAGARVGAYVVFHRDVPLLPDAVAVAAGYGARVRSEMRTINAIYVELPFDQVAALAADDAVEWVEPPLPRFGEVNDGVRGRTQADTLQTDPVYGLSGAGVTVLVYDGGLVDRFHPDFGGRVAQRDTGPVVAHATHVAGTIAGSGFASGGLYRGMAPAASIESFSFEIDPDSDAIPLFADPGDLETDYAAAISQFAVDLANNSIGSNVCSSGFDCEITGDYGVAAQLIDAVARGALGRSLPTVWSAGNERSCDRCRAEGIHTPQGYRSIPPPAAAKNPICIGAVNSNDDSMTPFSSWGPTDDGRLKPDVVAPGCEAADDFGVTSCSVAGGYIAFCGTSMAAPAVTGAAALLLEEHRRRSPDTGDPTNAAVKAVLVHTAEDLGTPGPDFQNGFGSVRARAAVDFLRAAPILDGSVGDGGSVSYLVRVPQAGPSFKATLTWDDVPAAAGAHRTLVNDLDLRVYDPLGQRRFPWTLDPSRPDAPARRTQPDHRNNVEQTLVEAPVPGLWIVQVYGFDVPEGPQRFTLCMSPAPEADCDGDGIPDAVQIAADPAADCTGNGLLDHCERDCNNNGVADSCDAAAGTSGDCNANDIADECDPDCDGDGTPDECAVRLGGVGDCDLDGTPDDCAPDCNHNGTADACELLLSTARDCDADGIPDDCEDTSSDCNGNGLWDRCDIAAGVEVDRNGNGVPDLCDARGRTHYVDATACPRPGQGTPEHPFCHIESALAAAVSGDVIELAPGLYTGPGNFNLDFGGRLVTVRSARPDNPAVVAGTVIDCAGRGRAFYFHNGETREAILDGLTLRGGAASLGSTPGAYRGGAVYVDGASPTIHRCVISGNLTGPTLAGGFGGGAVCSSGGSALIERCKLVGNATSNNGGAVLCLNEAQVEIEASLFLGNQAAFHGGAVAAVGGSVANLRSCVFQENAAGGWGGGVYAAEAVTDLWGCTFVGNRAGESGGGLYGNTGRMALTNTIVWRNAAAMGFDLSVSGVFELAVAYSDIDLAGPYSAIGSEIVQRVGDGVFAAEPGFLLDGSAGDEPFAGELPWHLGPGSPCIDAGHRGSGATDAAVDADGDSRVRHCRADIGADESSYFADCDHNGVADACEIAEGTAVDANDDGVPDRCVRCVADADCEDGRFCTGPEACRDGMCVAGAAPCAARCDERLDACVDCLTDADCDDRVGCTADTCLGGACHHASVPDCGPTFFLQAVAVNGVPLPAGPTTTVVAAPGDRVACDVFLENWSPSTLSAYQVSLDETGFATAALGHVRPVDDPTPAAGAFIDVARDDFVFAGIEAITAVSNLSHDVGFGGLAPFDAVPDVGASAYCGTLVLEVSDDAAGRFTFGPRSESGETFLLDRSGVLVLPLRTRSLSIAVPVAGCDAGPDCDADGLTDACGIALALTGDCNENAVPDPCDIRSGSSDDCNGNAVPDDCEPDCNRNHTADTCDIASGISGDCNRNSVPDECEDCNGNRRADECELAEGSAPDCNGNLRIDACDLHSGFAVDCNENRVPDDCDVARGPETDCNDNGIPDSCDLMSGMVGDCNENEIADVCEDCNGNGIADECDVASGASGDCNADKVPDECQDCNGNGSADQCDTVNNVSPDCNANRVPDECEDCNANGRADECDLADGYSEDRNRDGIPDECDLCAGVVCDDGRFCNGVESCLAGACRSGSAPCPRSGCDEIGRLCVECFTDADCGDGNDCTSDHCVVGRCAHDNTTTGCDDGDRCTINDACSGGGCAGTPLPGCGATFALRVANINGQALSGGQAARVRASPGDLLTCELTLTGWRPAPLSAYRAAVGTAGLSSAARGRLIPEPAVGQSRAAYVDDRRGDFVFPARAQIARAVREAGTIEFRGRAVFDAVPDVAGPRYAGTLTLRVSDDAAGAFRLGPRDAAEVELSDERGKPIGPVAFTSLIISVPPPGCEGPADCNGNGVRDACDLALGGSADCNRNGLPDECDVAKPGTSDDCSGNGVPDECEPDCNANGRADSCDIHAESSDDCDGNGVPDECEDCDDSGTGDSCDIAEGRAADCNANGIPDTCDVGSSTSHDCTGNGVPDECEPDCNGNGIADSCEVAGSPSADADENGVPDECQRVLRVPAEYSTIQAALDAGAEGDTVLVAPGRHTGAGNRTLDFRGKGLSLVCDAPAPDCVLDGVGDRPLLDFHGGGARTARVEGFTLTNGVGVRCRGSAPLLRRCAITSNPGGGIVALEDSAPVFESCLIARNSAPLGAGVLCRFSRVTLLNCTLADNRARFFGGAVYADAGEVSARSSILWGNQAPEGTQIALTFGSSADLRYCDVEGGPAAVDQTFSTVVWGSGNFTVDPAFAAAAAGNYRLKPGSRCIDAGDPEAAWPAQARDLDGEDRTTFTRVDVGADEARAFADCNGNGVPDWADTVSMAGPPLSADCNGNFLPDECEDCDGNGVADECDLSTGAALDCNANGVVDDCEAARRIVVASDPPYGAIDARQPTDTDGTDRTGWQAIRLTFDSEVADLGFADFVVTQVGGPGPVPRVRSVVHGPPATIDLILDRPIVSGAWTTIAYRCNGSGVRLGYLPGDVTGEGRVSVTDIIALVDALNGAGSRPVWSTDTDRSGVTSVVDVARLVDLLNGAGAFDPWLGRSLP
ncbi:MAG: S8 family serine peptidase [Planctomycetes bacterium]|nr:S8 family serine peptidase [Planctomycetota bacterium]